MLLFRQTHRRIVPVGLICSLLAAEVATAAPTTPKQARQAVVGWLKADSAPLGAQLASTVGEPVTYNDDAGRLAYYVVPLKPEGFVIVSGDDGVEPIIAFCASGTYDPSPAGPLGAMVARDLPGRVQVARNLQAANATAPEPDAPAKWADLIQLADATVTTGIANVSDLRVSPFVVSKWDQEQECGANCYNYYTPNNYVTGCVATALAQLLRYYQHPTTGIGVRSFTVYVNGVPQTAYTRGGDGAGGAYNWAQMPLDPDCSLTTTQRQAIGAILYDAGATVSMSYSAASSGADVFKAIDALKNVFGYSSGVKGYNNNVNLGTVLNTMINPNIDAGYPTILGISGPAGGHAVIPDGYGYNSGTLYHHVNMGWGGYDDMWYNLPTIDAYYTFNVVDVALYNIYVTGSGEIISGRVADMGGNPVSGATVTATRTGGGVYTDTTDSRGIYALVKLPANSSYSIVVTKTGMQFATQNVSTGSSADWGTNCGNKWGINFASTTGAPPQVTSANVDAVFNTAQTITLQATDDGLPNPPGVMTCIIKSLPTHGTLSVPGGESILAVPYNLPSNQVVYTPVANYSGPDGFNFAATDGGTAPNGGESGTATISIAVAACTTVAIGTQATTLDYPFQTSYSDARTQVVYLASEIGLSGNITSVSLNVTTITTATVEVWTIRMKHTTVSSYPTQGSLDQTGWTVVYQGTEAPGSTGWRTYNFTTPFSYNGTNNLLVDFSMNNSSYVVGNGFVEATSTGSTYRTVTRRSTTGTDNPLNWFGTTNAQRNNKIPNIRLGMCAAGGPPNAPTALTFSARTDASITWTWTDNSGNEEGFRGKDAAQTVKWTAAAGATSYPEIGLSPNTQYTRSVYAYNAAGESAASNSLTVLTLPAGPHVTCNRQVGCPAYAAGTAFTFTQAGLFGTGGVAHYHYVWDRNPTYSFNGSETMWSSGTVQLTASQVGNWYLHIVGHNDEHAPGAAEDLGPFAVAAVVGYAPGDLDHDCDVDQADFELFLACAAGPGTAQNTPSCLEARLDTDADVDAVDFGILQRCWSGSGTMADPACR